MKNKQLTVQPARKIYQPKYPSYADKNPLLYPETRPYPFTHKFINWASTGGLASMMLIFGNEAMAQTQPDSLYNPFPLENAQVPYYPTSFGTGMPERVRSEEAMKVIKKAFEESGVKLQEDYWINDQDVRVSGYSPEDEIGYLLLEYTTMDETFQLKREFSNKKDKQKKKKWNDISKRVEHFKQVRKESFERFMKDKDKYHGYFLRYKPQKAAVQIYADMLLNLEPYLQNELTFYEYFLSYRLEQFREKTESKTLFAQEVIQHIDQRFPETIEKHILFNGAINFKQFDYRTDQFQAEIEVAFNKLKKISSDEKFTEQYTLLTNFIKYSSGVRYTTLTKDAKYQELKVKIMQSHPIAKWFKKLKSLDNYKERKFTSLKEAQQIDRRNKNGKQMIAPISMRDQVMTVSGDRPEIPKELTEERKRLIEEMNIKNGMTPEVRARKQEEMKQLSKKYDLYPDEPLTREEKTALRKILSVERNNINEKYKAMELLTDEERADYIAKREELSLRVGEWRKERSEEKKLITLRKLEDEVKMYIKWAKSQMGN